MVRAIDASGTTLLVGAAMPGFLVAVKLGGSTVPESFGHADVAANGWLDAAFDVDTVKTDRFGGGGGGDGNSEGITGSTQSSPGSPPPLLAVVGPIKNSSGKSRMFALVNTSDTSGNFAKPSDWKLVGTASLPPHSSSSSTNNSSTNNSSSSSMTEARDLNHYGTAIANADISKHPSRVGAGPHVNAHVRAPGCNRVRVHQASKRAAFSCFGGGYGKDIVGFVDLSILETPQLIGTYDVRVLCARSCKVRRC